MRLATSPGYLSSGESHYQSLAAMAKSPVTGVSEPVSSQPNSVTSNPKIAGFVQSLSTFGLVREGVTKRESVAIVERALAKSNLGLVSRSQLDALTKVQNGIVKAFATQHNAPNAEDDSRTVEFQGSG